MSDGSTAAAAVTGDLWDAAERLRAVRRAHERFLGLWAMDSLLDARAASARAWTDIDLVDDGTEAGTPDNHALPDGLERPLFRRCHLDD
jgi:hypothetical protein